MIVSALCVYQHVYTKSKIKLENATDIVSKAETSLHWIPVVIMPSLFRRFHTLLGNTRLLQLHLNPAIRLFQTYSGVAIVSIGPRLLAPSHRDFFVFYQLRVSTSDITTEKGEIFTNTSIIFREGSGPH